MVEINEKRGPFRIKRVWFEEIEPSGCTLLRQIRVKGIHNYRTSRMELSYTPISDLSVDEKDILSKATKTVNNEVRRAEKEGIDLFFFDSEKMKNNSSIVDEFEEAYYKFANELKNDTVTSAYSRKKIEQYLEVGCFMLSMAKKEQLTVYHAYVYDKNQAVLVYSVSDFRDEHIDRNLAGRANKYLHVQDMLMFKKMGLREYDWGNVSDPENPNGIDKFKLSFGGELQKRYNVLVGCNIVGKILEMYYIKKKDTK